MSKTAKILIIVELLLSVAFCFVTLVLYSNKQNFKQLYENKLKDYKEQEELYIELQKKFDSEKDRYEKLLITKDDKIASLGQEVEQYKQEATKHKTTISKMEIAIDDYKAQIKDKDDELAKRQDKIEQQHQDILKLKQNLDDATRNENEAVEKNIALQDLNSNYKQDIVKLNKQINGVQEQLDEKQWMLKRLEEQGIPITDIVLKKEKGPTKPIDAYVLAVNPGLNLVMLSVGKEDKVEPGYIFTIYRDNNYIGKAKVEEVFKDMCSAMVIKKYINRNGLKVKEGDNASTKVY